MKPFNRVSEADLAYFESVLPGRVFSSDTISTDYDHDEMPIYGHYAPEAVLQAQSAEEISAVLHYCNGRNIAVTPRGAGTGLCGGCVAMEGGVVLSTERMKRVLEVDTRNMTATVETVVLLSHKKADSYIHIDVEFGEGEGKIPVDSIAKRAEAYKPKEKVTYKMIKEYIEAKYGFKVHTAYIAEVKRNLGLPMYDAPNAVEELKQPRKHPTPEKVEAIKDALRYFAVI